MTSRGSRFNPYSGGAPGQNSQEWIGTTTRNTREFIRKWGHMIKHDQYMKPIVPPKYEVGIVVENCTPQLLEALEPWCSYIYVDMEEFVIYSMKEQEKSSFNIDERVRGFDPNKHVIKDNITIKIDGNTFGNEEYRHIQYLPEILANDDELYEEDLPCEFTLGNLQITINDLTTYENELIICD